MHTSPLVIAGMHRSGTSMAANALADAGLRFGTHLLPPSPANPRGYYEDKDVIAWHDAVLNDNGATWYDAARLNRGSLTVSPARRQALSQLIAMKFPGNEPWGIKDPRATLFLETWAQLFPDARFLLLHREPEQVVYSLLRRRDFDGMHRTKLGRAARSLKLWTIYNHRVLDFAARYPDRCRVLRVPDELLESEPRLQTWLRLPVDFAGTFSRELMQPRTPRWLKVWATAASATLCKQLNQQPTLAIISPRGPDDCETFIRAHVDHLPWPRRVLHGGDFPRYDQNQRLPFNPGKASDRALARYLQRHHIAAVLAEYGPTGAAVRKACALAGIPLVVHFHGYDAYMTRTLITHNTAYCDLFESASAVIAVSRHMLEQLIHLGCPRHKLHWLPYGVDLSRFVATDPASAQSHLVAVGRLVDKKAPLLTLRAFAKALLQHPDARLTIIGDGPLMEPCRELMNKLRIGHAVSLPGAQPHEAVAQAMSQARAFVQHSVRADSGDCEGTPVAVLEACATALPVIATRHAGINDVIEHERSGLLVEEGDIDEMAAHMSRLIADPQLARRMGATGRQFVEQHHNQPQQIAKLATIIEQAMHGKSAATTSARRVA